MGYYQKLIDVRKMSKPKRLPKYLTEEDVKLLLNIPYKTRMDHILMMRLAYNCGMRNSEVCYITVENFDFDDLSVTVLGGKGEKDRIIHVLTHELVQLFKEYIENNNLKPQDRLFDMKPRGFTAMVKRYGKRAGIERNIYPHMLRHSFAVHSLKAGVNLRSVQKALGHASLTSTQVYLDIVGEDVKEDYRRHPLPV